MFWRKKKKHAPKQRLPVEDLLKVQLSRRRCPPVNCACVECPNRYSGFMGGCEFIPWHISTCQVCRMNISNGIDVGYVGGCSVKKAIQGEFNEKKEGTGRSIRTDDINKLPEPDGACLPSINEILF